MTKKIKVIFLALISVGFQSSVFAHEENRLANAYIQSIQVVNLLANSSLADPGMTPTSVIIKYYNGAQNPCWVTTLNYQDDVTIHAGPTQGCVKKVDQIVVEPVLVAGKLRTYLGPIPIYVDTNKYSSQITILQDKPPIFNTESGLIDTPGVIKISTQAQL